jgi:hypothetical protein
VDALVTFKMYKKLVFLITSVIYSLTCLGQQISLNNEVKINLPNRTEKLTKDQVSSFAGKRFNHDKIALSNIADFNTPHLYKVDNVLISFNTASGSTEEGHLLKLKNGLDEMSKKNKSYSSNIKTVNNSKVLIINETLGNVEYYNFYCFKTINAKRVTAITGTLQFDKSDHDNASNILDDVLKGIKFKN